MIPIYLGENRTTRQPVFLDPDMFRTHMHLIGATGSGKTTAVHAILKALMLQVRHDECCLFVIDPMGNLSRDLLAYIAHPTFSTNRIRERLVYIEPAREDVVMSFNPLTYSTPANRYYQTMRAVDLVLRGWSAQDVSQQPRLLQWTFKAFCAAAMMGLPISMCQHLVHTGTPEHSAILDRIPGDIRNHWLDILNARGGEATRILESTRNRLDPFFQSPILRAMFGTRKSRFDCERFIREKRIVILNLAKMRTIPGLTADTIGALALNEIFETANRLTTTAGRSVVDPTYVLLDEFQKYVSIDIEDALPTVRQMGLRLILAHQSFAQLEREDVNLEQMVWQARSRLMFANYAKDADLLADELAKMTFNNKVIKDVRKSKKQLIAGYRKEWLENESESQGSSSGSVKQKSGGESDTTTFATDPLPWGSSKPTSEAKSKSFGEANSDSDSRTAGYSSGRGQSMVPIHTDIEEISSITYESFEEYSIKWGQQLRRLRQGEAFLQLPGRGEIDPVLIDYEPIEETPALREAVSELIQQNFESEFFVSLDAANKEYDQCWQDMLRLPLQGESSQHRRTRDRDTLKLPAIQPADDTPPSGFTL